MYGYDDDEEVQQRIEIPRYRVIHKDLDAAFEEKIMTYVAECVSGNDFDKDFAEKIIEKLNNDEELNKISQVSLDKNWEEFGVWQAIVGKHYVASVCHDTRYVFYFYLIEQEKYLLLFRS